MLIRLGLAGMLLAVSAFGIDTRIADAVQHGDGDAVRALLKQKVDVNAAQGDGMTALHWAASLDDLATARLLLAAGAKVDARTRLGAVSPLFMAARNGSAPMIEMLLKAGASTTQADATGTTPLMVVAESGNTDAIKVLAEHGANVNAVENAHGQTALMFAAAYNRDAAVKLLISLGAKPEATSKVLDPGCGSVFNRNECDQTDEFGNPMPKKAETRRPKAASAPEAKSAATKETPDKETLSKRH